ncbi:hypothetical protein BH10PSE7_BH10PSE7_09290 [soil metagenome]
MPREESRLIDEKWHCQELNTGKRYPGYVQIGHNEIFLQLWSYGKYLQIDASATVFVQTESNDIVSLHRNVTGIPSIHARNLKPRRTVFKQTIHSSIAVVGPDRWEEADKVKSVTFFIEHADKLLEHQATTDRIARWKPEDGLIEGILFSEKLSEVTTQIKYNAKYSFKYSAVNAISPYFRLEFSNGVSLFEYTNYVTAIAQFLSVSLGIRLTPSEIRISRFSYEEEEDACEENKASP